ncbi:MAG: hypothetical protein MJ222_00410 [Bacilli bacterium]|nr:hypothetical protein [Bacilli bacterium]
MKKSLFLLPLLAAFALCGCGDNGGGGSGGGGGGSGGGGGGSGGGGGGGTLGALIAKITMKNPSSTGTKVSDDEYTWSKNGCEVKVETYKNEEANQYVAKAVELSKQNEMRVYNKYLMTLSSDQEFSAFKVICTTFSDGKYNYDDPNLEGATFEFDGTDTTTVYLDQPASEWEVYAYKQIRVTAVEFYK